MHIQPFFCLMICTLAWSMGFAQNAGDYVLKKHEIEINGSSLKYNSYAGTLPLRDEFGNILAHIFFTYYKAETEPNQQRPLTLAFNGGPGSPAAWIHLGGIGPHRIVLNSLSPKYAENKHTWLEFTDLVFIDPVNTGFSRPAAEVKSSHFNNYATDISSIAGFIHQFINHFDRWESALYVLGESYGSIRAVGTVHLLQHKYNIYPKGLFLVSGLLDYQTIDTGDGNELPYVLRLPSVAATAWYHHKRSHTVSLHDYLRESEVFAINNYLPYLFKGNQATEEEKMHSLKGLARITGIAEHALADNNLRLDIDFLMKQLSKDGNIIGRLDTRISGMTYFNSTKNAMQQDPSLDPILKAKYTPVVYAYIKNKLGYKYENLSYDIISGKTYPWNFNSDNKFLNVIRALGEVMTQNPDLKIWVTGGIFDLGTPYYASVYSINHLWIKEPLKRNIFINWYEGGHMFYHDDAINQIFKHDAKIFYRK